MLFHPWIQFNTPNFGLTEMEINDVQFSLQVASYIKLARPRKWMLEIDDQQDPITYI